MNKNLAIALAVIIVIIIAAVPILMKQGGGEETTTEEYGTIKIGMTISLQGKYQTEGKQALCGVEAAIKWYNDNGGIEVDGKKYKLELKYYDDQSKKELVQSYYADLVTKDKVNFLLAPYSSGLTLAAAPVSQQYGIIMISHGGASDKIFSQGFQYVVQVLTPASKYFESSLKLVKEQIPDAKIAFIYENSAFSNAVMQGASQIAQELGLQVVYNNTYEKGQTEFTSLVQEAKQAGANVLIGGGHFEDGQILINTAYNNGWHLKFISILVAPAQPEFAQAVGDAAIGVAAPAQWHVKASYSPDNVPSGYVWAGPTKEEWLQAFQAVCPDLETPAYQAAEAGASIVFLVEAIKSANSLDNQAVRQAMNNLAIYTFFGPLKIDPETGKQIAHPMIVIQWQEQNGQLVQEIIYPPESATAQPLIAPAVWWPTG
ncbi:MAG: amino acid ABC transporter substrate-binding protein [Desulfurococcales archaeon]|nr:amino acid ABC transporter substrate-binding protein [Desulfurococcales archaeon]